MFVTGFEPEQPPNFSTGKILKYDQLKHFRNARVIKYGSQTGLTQGVIAMWGTDIKSDNQDMELPNKEKKVGFFNQIEIASLQYHSNFFDAGDSGSLVFVKQGDGPEVYCIGLAVGWTSYHSCLVTPIEEVFKKLGLPAIFIDDTKV